MKTNTKLTTLLAVCCIIAPIGTTKAMWGDPQHNPFEQWQHIDEQNLQAALQASLDEAQGHGHGQEAEKVCLQHVQMLQAQGKQFTLSTQKWCTICQKSNGNGKDEMSDSDDKIEIPCGICMTSDVTEVPAFKLSGCMDSHAVCLDCAKEHYLFRLTGTPTDCPSCRKSITVEDIDRLTGYLCNRDSAPKMPKPAQEAATSSSSSSSSAAPQPKPQAKVAPQPKPQLKPAPQHVAPVVAALAVVHPAPQAKVAPQPKAAKKPKNPRDGHVATR